MFWLKAKDINEAINRAADCIVSKIDVMKIKTDVTDTLKRNIVEIILRDCGYNMHDNEYILKSMVEYQLKQQAILLAEKAMKLHEARILDSLDSKEIQQLVEKGIKDKVKESLK